MAVAHKTVLFNVLNECSCRTGCGERRVRSDCFLPVFLFCLLRGDMPEGLFIIESKHFDQENLAGTSEIRHLPLRKMKMAVWKLWKRLSANLYHAGVAAVTVSSLLRGILEIAGTASDYQAFLMTAGAFLLACGSAAYMIGK